MHEVFLKGIFWVTCRYAEQASGALACDFSEGRLVARTLACDRNGVPFAPEACNAKNGLTFAHERTWNALVQRENAELSKHKWNYFPRGRVEVKNGIALLYANPRIADDPSLIALIMERFSMDTARMRIIADGSAHYACYADERTYAKHK